MRMLPRTAFACLALLSASVHAQTTQSNVAHSGQSEYATPDFSDKLLIPQFDPSQGQLQYLTISVTATLVTSTVDPEYLQALIQQECNPGLQIAVPIDAAVDFADGFGDSGRATDQNEYIYNCPLGGDGGGRPSYARPNSTTSTVTVAPPQANAYIGAGNVSLSEAGSTLGQDPNGAYDIIVSTEITYFYSDVVFANGFE
jgi:hypothetical protein